MIFPFIKPFYQFFQYDTRYITLFTAVLRSFASDVIRRSIMTSRKARRFRAIFARNFPQNCQRLRDITHTTRFINTVWDENSFQILYVWVKPVFCGMHIAPAKAFRHRQTDVGQTTKWSLCRALLHWSHN